MYNFNHEICFHYFLSCYNVAKLIHLYIIVMVTIMITVKVSSLDHFIELARVPTLHIITAMVTSSYFQFPLRSQMKQFQHKLI